MAPKVEIYTEDSWPFCIRAKQLLNRNGINFTEYAVDGDQAARPLMTERAKDQYSVPQIFIHDQHVGGCNELYALESQGKLNTLIQESST